MSSFTSESKIMPFSCPFHTCSPHPLPTQSLGQLVTHIGLRFEKNVDFNKLICIPSKGNMLLSASLNDLVVAKRCLFDVSSGTRRCYCLKRPKRGAHVWTVKDGGPPVINKPPAVSSAWLLLRPGGLSQTTCLSARVDVPRACPVCYFAHMPYFALGQTSLQKLPT